MTSVWTHEDKTFLYVTQDFLNYARGYTEINGVSLLNDDKAQILTAIQYDYLKGVNGLYNFNPRTTSDKVALTNQYGIGVLSQTAEASADLVSTFAFTHDNNYLQYIPTTGEYATTDLNIDEIDIPDGPTYGEVNKYYTVVDHDTSPSSEYITVEGTNIARKIPIPTTNFLFGKRMFDETNAASTDYYGVILNNDWKGTEPENKLKSKLLFNKDDSNLLVNELGQLTFKGLPVYYLIFIGDNTYENLDRTSKAPSYSLISLTNDFANSNYSFISDLNELSFKLLDYSSSGISLSPNNYVLSPTITNFRTLFLELGWIYNISNWNTEKITRFDYFLFNNTLYNIPLFKNNGTNGLKNFKISSEALNLSHMFDGCTSLEKLFDFNESAINKFNISENIDSVNVSDMSYMFNGCENLTDAKFLNYISLAAVTNMKFILNDCKKIKNDLSSFFSNINSSSTSSLKDIESAFINLHQNATSLENKTLTNLLDGSTISLGNVTLLKEYYNYILSNYGITDIYNSGLTEIFYIRNIEDLQNILINFSESVIRSTPIVNVDLTNLSSLMTSDTVDTSSITALKLNSLIKLDTSNVTNMSSMFEGDNIGLQLTGFSSSDVSCLNIKKVNDDGDVQYSLSYSPWNTQNVTNFSNMFNGCEDFNNNTFVNNLILNSSQLPNMIYMFNGCTGLIGRDISGFIRKLANLFNTLSPINTKTTDMLKNTTNTEQQQNYINILYYKNTIDNAEGANTLIDNGQELSISYINNIFGIESGVVNKVFNSNYEKIFSGETPIRQVRDSIAIDTSDVTEFNTYEDSGTKLGFNKFTSGEITDNTLNLSSWSMSNAINISDMFHDCILNINCQGWNLTNIKFLNDMFHNSAFTNWNNLNSWLNIGSSTSSTTNIEMSGIFAIDTFSSGQTITTTSNDIFSHSSNTTGIGKISNISNAFKNSQKFDINLTNFINKLTIFDSGTQLDIDDAFLLTSLQTDSYYHYHSLWFFEFYKKYKLNYANMTGSPGDTFDSNDPDDLSNINTYINNSGLGIWINRTTLPLNTDGLSKGKKFLTADQYTSSNMLFFYDKTTTITKNGAPMDLNYNYICKFNMFLRGGDSNGYLLSSLGETPSTNKMGQFKIEYIYKGDAVGSTLQNNFDAEFTDIMNYYINQQSYSNASVSYGSTNTGRSLLFNPPAANPSKTDFNWYNNDGNFLSSIFSDKFIIFPQSISPIEYIKVTIEYYYPSAAGGTNYNDSDSFIFKINTSAFNLSSDTDLNKQMLALQSWTGSVYTSSLNINNDGPVPTYTIADAPNVFIDLYDL